MQLTLRQLITEEEIQAIVQEAVKAILEKTVSFSFIAEGIVEDQTKGFTCPECGQTGFKSAAAMAGHRYWKHNVATDSKRTPAEIKKESSERTAAIHKEKT